MSTEKRIGKITHATFGLGGYQGATIGLHLQFGSREWGVGASHSAWDPATVECGKHCKWTEADRSKQLSEVCRKVSEILFKAKANSVSDLVGKPVEVEFDAMTLKSWRIVEEAI